MSFYKSTTAELKKEMWALEKERNYDFHIRRYALGIGYSKHLCDHPAIARAYAFAEFLDRVEKIVYDNDIILGSLIGEKQPKPDDWPARGRYLGYADEYGERGWVPGHDHYASAYDRLIELGIGGIMAEIEESRKKFAGDYRKEVYLEACKISMEAFSKYIADYAEKAKSEEIRQVCLNIVTGAPQTFQEGLQLVWFAHNIYVLTRHYANALGRIDQYLYPLYKKDIEAGIMDRETAVALLENTFMKIHEHRVVYGHDDVCNICIGGITRDGENAVNDLSYDVLHAVGNCYVAGPNLSARINPKTPDEFVCECLKVVGTGLGYPALMNDEPIIKALLRMGYEERDANNFCMVGCIENFIPGSQPPWSDGRVNVLKMLEYTLFNGRNLRNKKDPDAVASIETGNPEDFKTMDEFMDAFKEQIKYGAEQYAHCMIRAHTEQNNEDYVFPFMSCLSYKCVERGLDLCNGGALYPAAHGACIMGIGTVSDCLASIEKNVFIDKTITMKTLLDALRANFEGYEDVQKLLLAAPKYGNDCDFVDKYAVWLIDFTADIFDGYRLTDGGRFYTAAAANIANIDAGEETIASADGRKAGDAISDAASPTYGRDTNGPTYTVASISKPDYSRLACGSVVNQKYSPEAFETEENIKRLCALVRIYFERGGQEMQINSVSREVLKDAMEHPENYRGLIVRVSGFSAYFVNLRKEVQLDILNRTVQA